jgi:hypothetical protein
MFRDERQRLDVVRIWLGSLGLERFWTIDGPTEAAIKVVRSGSPLSHGQTVMLRIAFDIWNGEGNARFADCLYVLDSTRMRLIGTFIVAFAAGGHAIDRWISENVE